MTTAFATPAPAQPAVAPYPQVPTLAIGPAVACLVVNVILPGLGTLIAGIIGQRPLVGRAVAQFLLAIILVGWIWGVVTGVQLLTNANWAEKTGAPTA